MTDVQSIMRGDPDGSELVLFARQTADKLVHRNLSRAQIRNIFTEVRKIEAMWGNRPADAMRRLNMLKPKLDYTAERSKEVQELKDVLNKAIDEVNAVTGDERDKRFKRFMDLFEAILAYHRALGGRN